MIHNKLPIQTQVTQEVASTCTLIINNSEVRESIYLVEFDDDYYATIYRSALRNDDRRTHYALCALVQS